MSGSESGVKTIIVGDLQGCMTEFKALLDTLNFDPGSQQIWLVGDLVNRGPDSLGTLRLARNLGAACRCVLGNHDLSTLALAFAPASGQEPDVSQRALFDAPDGAELLDWLRYRPLLHRTGDTVMVHAGLPPQWTIAQAQNEARNLESVLRGPQHVNFFRQMYGDWPVRWSPDLDESDRLRFATNCFTRLRYCSTNGDLELGEKGAPGSQAHGLLPWFAIPGRASLSHRIVFGHWSTLGRVFWPQYRVWGLDTGCVWGGRLTALVLETQRLIGVPSAGYKKPGS